MSSELVNPDSIRADFVPIRRETLASIEIDGEGLLFDEDRGAWHFLNPVAQIIWTCCDGTGSIEEIARDMSDVFGEGYDTVLDGILDTVRRMGHQGLLEGVEQTAAASGHGHDHDHDHDHEEEIHDPSDGEAEPRNEPRFLQVPPSA